LHSTFQYILGIHRILSVALAFLLWPSVIQATQPYTPTHPDPILEKWRWKSFPELSGLGLLCLAEDRDKNMWFGLRNGVRKYDGLTWTEYTSDDGLPDTPVFSLCAARDGSVYAGSHQNLSHFVDGVWQQIFPSKNDTTPWYVCDIIESANGSIWAATVWGALNLKGEKATLYTTAETETHLKASNPHLSFVIVPDHAVTTTSWQDGIGAKMARVVGFSLGETKTNIIVALALGGPAQTAGLKIGDQLSLAVEVNGPANTQLTLSVTRKTETFETTITRAKINGSVQHFQILHIFEDRDGNVWFGPVEAPEPIRYTPSKTGAEATIMFVFVSPRLNPTTRAIFAPMPSCQLVVVTA